MNTEQRLRELRERFDQQRVPIGLYSCMRLRLPTADANLSAGWGEFLGDTVVPFGFHVLRELPVFEACFFGDHALLPRFQSLAADAQQVCPAFFVDSATASYNFCDAHSNWLFALHRLGWTQWAEMQTDFLGQADRLDDSLDEAVADLFFLINQQPSRHVDIIADWLQTAQNRGMAPPKFVYQRLGRDLFSASAAAIDFVLEQLADVSDVSDVPDLVEFETSSSDDQVVADGIAGRVEVPSRHLGIQFTPVDGRVRRHGFSNFVYLTRSEAPVFDAILRENGNVCHYDALDAIAQNRGTLQKHISNVNAKLLDLGLSLECERELGYRLVDI